MPTGIDKSPYLLVLTAYDYIGLVEYGVDFPVAGCRQLVDAACGPAILASKAGRARARGTREL